MQTKGQTKKSALYALWYNNQLVTKKKKRANTNRKRIR